jgi:two-component system NtrC family sensor kinase
VSQHGSVEDLQKENRRLAIISQIARSIVVNMSYGEVIDQFSTALRTAIPFDLLSFCLLEGGNLVIKSGLPKEQMVLGIGTVMGREYYIPWRAVQDRRACLRRDIWTDEHQGAEDAPLRRLGIRSAVVAPLLVQDRVIGTLNLGNRDPYSEADAVYVQQLADQLAVCLLNSRLYREVAAAWREWELTFQAVQDLLLVVDPDQTIVRVNHDPEGQAAEQLVGRTCREVFDFCSDEVRGGPVAAAIDRRREVSTEWVTAGSARTLSVSAYPVLGEQGEVAKVVLCVRDVTARRKLEMQLHQSAKLAALGEMAAGVAHELNSPLTAILGNAGLLLRRSAAGDRSRPLLEDIKGCGQRCKKIIGSMLTFARRDSYAVEPVGVNPVVESSLDLARYPLEESHVVLDKDLAEGLPDVLGSSHQIEQVVVNLLLNARDALEGVADRRITVATARAALDTGETGVAICVSDTGSGMDPADQERIFDPFFTTKEGARGTGLGLSVSLGIARAHGGTIQVESQPGRGSTFRLVLPQMARRIVDFLHPQGSLGEEEEGVAAEVLEPLLPALALARSLGRLLAQLGGADPRSVELEYPDQTAVGRTGLLTAAALDGLLADRPGAVLDLDSAAAAAQARGIRVTETISPGPEDHDSFMRLRVETGTGSASLAGAIFGRVEPRVVEVDGVKVEALPQGHLLVFWAHDRPGLVGGIGSVLAAHGINIRQMRSGCEAPGGRAVAVFNVDSPVGAEVLEELGGLSDLISIARATL